MSSAGRVDCCDTFGEDLLVLEETAQLEGIQISGLEGLAELIATVYKGAEEKLEKHIGGPRGFSTKDWVYDYLEDLEGSGEPGTIRRFIGQLSRVDRIAEQIEIDIDDIPHDRKPSEILKRLGIREYSAPIGIYTDLGKMESIKRDYQRLHNYRNLLGHGVDACKVIEHMLKLLALFYGEFCFEGVFSQKMYANPGEQVDLSGVCSKTISHSSIMKLLRNLVERRMDVDLGKTITLLCRLDEYSKTLEKFQESFGRYSIFSYSAHNSTPSQGLTVMRRSKVQTTLEVQTVLSDIRRLRNDLPHDKSMNPEKTELQTVTGLRSHLGKFFDAVARFTQYGEQLRLFPSLGLLVQKCEHINLGPRLEMVAELDTRVSIPCSDLVGYNVGTEYFFWPGLGSHKSEYILVPKCVPLGG